MRRIRIFYVHVLDIGQPKKSPEWKERECGNWLEKGQTQCGGCERGWEVRDNHFLENKAKYRKASDEIRRTSMITITAR
jgi:hypothetical protein